MQDMLNSMEISLAGLDRSDWQEQLGRIADEHGMYQPLGERHFATFVEEKRTLLVSFETADSIHAMSEEALPFGFDLVKAQGWSHLCVVSHGETWFRDARVYGFFDRLIDDGFFEDFDDVLFYGAGSCGYAAAAFSVAAPGATVIAIQPQATLDPRMTEWETRFTQMRRTSFTDRYGYAPDMLDAAERAFVIYDPRQELDAMHATLFARSNVTRLRMPFMGGDLQTRLIQMDLLYRIVNLAGAGKLDALAFARLYRIRRDFPPYLRRLMNTLDDQERPYLNVMLCRNAVSRIRAPRIRRRLDALMQAADSGAFVPPPRRQ